MVASQPWPCLPLPGSNQPHPVRPWMGRRDRGKQKQKQPSHPKALPFPRPPAASLVPALLPSPRGATEQTPKVGDIFLCILAPNAILSGHNFPKRSYHPWGLSSETSPLGQPWPPHIPLRVGGRRGGSLLFRVPLWLSIAQSSRARLGPKLSTGPTRVARGQTLHSFALTHNPDRTHDLGGDRTRRAVQR